MAWCRGRLKHTLFQCSYTKVDSRFVASQWETALLCNDVSHWVGASLESHYDNLIRGAIASQITSLTIVYSAVYSGADQSKHQSSASLAFVWGIHREPVNSPHKWPVTRKMFPFDDVIMIPGLRPANKRWHYFVTPSLIGKINQQEWCYNLAWVITILNV